MAARLSPAQLTSTLRVWDLASGETVRTLSGHTGSVWAVAVTPDGRQVVSGSDDNTLRVWDLASGETVRTLSGHTGAVFAVAVTPDGRQAVSGSYDNTLRVWDLPVGMETACIVLDTAVSSIAAAPDGRTVVAGDMAGNLWCLRYSGDWLSSNPANVIV